MPQRDDLANVGAVHPPNTAAKTPLFRAQHPRLRCAEHRHDRKIQNRYPFSLLGSFWIQVKIAIPECIRISTVKLHLFVLKFIGNEYSEIWIPVSQRCRKNMFRGTSMASNHLVTGEPG